MPVHLGSGESPLSSLNMAAFSLCPCRAERQTSLVSLIIRTLILLNKGPTFITPFTLHYVYEGLIFKTAILEIKVSTSEFQVNTIFLHSTIIISCFPFYSPSSIQEHSIFLLYQGYLLIFCSHSPLL